MKYGPVLTSMNTYKGAKLVDDIYTWDAAADYGRHCVLIVGWDERGWLIQNSWGTSYGGDGRFVIPYNYKLNESWGVTDDIQDDTDIKKPNAFIKFISTIYNKIVNFFWKYFKK
jgi:C1A family cysteine protease